MGRSRYRIHEPDQVHFLTCTIVEWLPVFSRPEAVEAILQTWRHQQVSDGLRLYGFVVMENHLHAVAQADNLATLWSRFKSYSARQILATLEETGSYRLLERLGFPFKAQRSDRAHQLWQEGSHPQAVTDSEMLHQKLRYIHHNPVKRGYVDEPEHWRWSSARNYAGLPGVIDVFMDWH